MAPAKPLLAKCGRPKRPNVPLAKLVTDRGRPLTHYTKLLAAVNRKRPTLSHGSDSLRKPLGTRHGHSVPAQAVSRAVRNLAAVRPVSRVAVAKRHFNQQ